MSAADDFAAVLAEAATLSREAQAAAIAGANPYAAQEAIRRLAAKALEFRQRLARVVDDLDGSSYSVNLIAWPPSIEVSVTWNARPST